MKTRADFAQLRKEFPLLLQKRVNGHPLVYLDSAATTHKPECVIETLSHFYREEYATVHRALYGLSSHATMRYAAVREQVRKFLNAASSDEIIFTKGTTDGINLVASSFGKALVHPDDEILITEMEHHANLVPWQQLCQEKGAHLRVVPMNERGELDLAAFEKLLTERTKLVAIAHVCNSIGTLNPLAQIIPLAHAKGAKVLVDGAQSAGHMPVDVQRMDADFYVFSGHKTFGPTGVGILYGKKQLLEIMPPYQCGGDMIEKVTFEKTTFQPPPLKFEAGTPLIAEVIGLGAALSFIEEWGREEIAAWEQELLAYATEKLTQVPGMKIIGSPREKGPIICFTLEGMHPLDVGTLLDLKGICVRTGHLCAQPALRKFGLREACRLSLGAYNTFEELDFLCSTLTKL